jgi:hypothetical protein
VCFSGQSSSSRLLGTGCVSLCPGRNDLLRNGRRACSAVLMHGICPLIISAWSCNVQITHSIRLCPPRTGLLLGHACEQHAARSEEWHLGRCLTQVVVQGGLVWTTAIPRHHPGCSDRLRARQLACILQITSQAQRSSTRCSKLPVRHQLLARGSRAQRLSPVHAGTLRTSELDVRARPKAHRARCLQWSAPARDPIQYQLTLRQRTHFDARGGAVSLRAQAWPILAAQRRT